MEMTNTQIEQLIKSITDKVTQSMSAAEVNGSQSVSAEVNDGIFDDMDAACEAAYQAWTEYMECSMAARRKFINAIRDFCLQDDVLKYMSEETVKESGMGNAHDKYQKNYYATKFTPGVEDLITEAFTGDDGLTTLEYSPYGVVGAIAPTTNPTETIINNGIGMLAAGDTVVFSPHPAAKNISLWLIRQLNKVLAAAGAPKNLLVSVQEPSIENTQKLMENPRVRLLVATGGPGIVHQVLSSGKKAIGAGAGNPPVVVDQTADIVKAGKDIVDGSSFDNNLPCTAEKEIIAVDSIADLLMLNMRKNGAFEIKRESTIKKLEELVITDKGTANKKWVGKSAAEILNAIGITQVPKDTRLIVCEATKDHPFVQVELLMPILPMVRVANVDEAIDLAVELEHGLRHTAIMHSTNVHSLTKMARKIQTTIFVKNGPSYNGIGIGGEGYPTFTIAGPTGEGLTSARSFARRRRCVMVGELNVR